MLKHLGPATKSTHTLLANGLMLMLLLLMGVAAAPAGFYVAQSTPTSLVLFTAAAVSTVPSLTVGCLVARHRWFY